MKRRPGGACRGEAGGRSGFFIPYRHAPLVTPCHYPAIERLFETVEDGFREWIERIEKAIPQLRRLRGPPPEPRFEQEWFPRLDAAIAYVLVRSRRPRRIVEIGSGHSTRFLARAIRDGQGEGKLVCIDPDPRADLAGLSVEHHRRRLEEVDEVLFEGLGAGDVLFVDSSHVAMPGSDVDRIFNRILPRLQPGVLLHFHDIFLPDPYPEAWSWRAYNEQLLVAAWLLTGGLRPLFASHWVASRRPQWLAGRGLASLPLRPGVPESSLWVEMRAGSR